MPAKRSGVVLVICAPSGTGKTTLIKRLRNEFPNFGFSVSYTTRQRRESEEDGKDYHFISIEEFKEKRKADFFAEWAFVHGNYYATPLEPTLNMLKEGKDIIYDVDVQGAAQLRLTLPSACYIFILPPSLHELKSRLLKRASNNEAQIAKRMSNAVLEIKESHWFDYLIVNNDLDTAYDHIRAAYIATTLCPKKMCLNLNDILQDYAPDTENNNGGNNDDCDDCDDCK